MSIQEKQPHTENMPETTFDTPQEQLSFYFDSLYANEHLPSISHEQQENARVKTLHYLERNNFVAAITDSKEYREIVEKEKELRGKNCRMGFVFCIDGRMNRFAIGGFLAKGWEKMAGLMTVTHDPLDKDKTENRLGSDKINRAIYQMPSKGYELIQIQLAHYSQSDPDHGCGAMAAMRAGGLVPDNTDIVEENLKLLAKREDIITETYNRAIRTHNRQYDQDLAELKQVAVNWAFETDTLGFVANYGQDEKLFTTEQTHRIARNNIANLARFGEAGFFQKQFTEPDHLVEFETHIYEVTKALLEDKEYQEMIEPLLASYPDLTDNQLQALLYAWTRNIAFQYVAGTHMFDNGDPDHPFAHHEEHYQSLSTDGVSIGEYDPGIQVFSASAATPEDAIQHVCTECVLMDGIKAEEEPYVLFLSQAIQKNISLSSLEDAIVDISKYYSELLSNEDILKRVKEGKLVIVPALVDEKTREILHVPNCAL